MLSIVDDASVYHVLQRLTDRSTGEIMEKLTNGWFAFFGFPDELLLDAEGAMASMEFSKLTEQCGIKIRFVPKDAHWQLGKGESHGTAARWIFERTANQYGITTSEEVDIGLAMTANAKNTLTNRSGSSPVGYRKKSTDTCRSPQRLREP